MCMDIQYIQYQEMNNMELNQINIDISYHMIAEEFSIREINMHVVHVLFLGNRITSELYQVLTGDE